MALGSVLQSRKAAIRGVEEMPGGKVRLILRDPMTDEEMQRLGDVGNGVIGREILTAVAEQDKEEPFKPGDPVTVQVIRGQEDE